MPKTKSPAPQQHHQLAIHTLVSIMPWDTVEKSAKFQANSATCSLLSLRVVWSPRVPLASVAVLASAFASGRRVQSVVSSSVPSGRAVAQSCSRVYLQHHSTAQFMCLRNAHLHGSSSSSSSSYSPAAATHHQQLLTISSYQDLELCGQ